jgi:UDP-N-acetylmuramoyl-tripeptide--D-alanyl-D-alanine ligase
MSVFKGFLSQYRPSYLRTIVYMLQNTEYQAAPYLKWYWRTKDFGDVMRRRTLDKTRAARSLLLALQLGVCIQLTIAASFMYLGIWHNLVGGVGFGAAIVVIYPVLWAHLIVVPLMLGRELIVKPRDAHAIKRADRVFANHQGVKIAVAGSYGKTTMKELLATVLSEGLKVAATPANKNVSSSHARFAQHLIGEEDVLIIEYGEGAPGDVARFAKRTHPTHAVITGLAPAHLDHYKTLAAAGKDIFSLAGFVPAKQLYVNHDSPSVKPYLKEGYRIFDGNSALGWKTSQVKVGLEGTSFTLTKGKHTIKLASGLVGRHQVGYLAFVAALALELGLTDKQVRAGVAKTKPFEHRMQPYRLSGAWVVDDTYNGNLEGIRAGTQLLSELKANRKIYVTPGLVDQGEETERVHLEVGRLIAAAKPDLVVLMKNSVTAFIEKGLTDAKFNGELRIEYDPLEFYTNLQHFLAVGDLVLMQNDWPDNYV